MIRGQKAQGKRLKTWGAGMEMCIEASLMDQV